jgi:HD-like signal output (HDOD) protein
MLGESWGLPTVLTAAMRHHRDPDYRGTHWRLTAACGLAASMAAALRRGLDRMPEDGGASPLNLPPAASEALFRQMAARRESVRDLARALFGG